MMLAPSVSPGRMSLLLLISSMAYIIASARCRSTGVKFLLGVDVQLRFIYIRAKSKAKATSLQMGS